MELKELVDKTLKIFGINNVRNLAGELMQACVKNDESKFRDFKVLVGDLNIDWLQKIFQYYEADRKEKKQDYTPKSLAALTSLGSVTYHKTLFKNKFTGKYEYLLDRVMGIEKHERMSEDAVAELLGEAVQTSYRKGGISACMTEECVSKETVMNKLHALEFPKNTEQLEKKKVVDYLYIDADEDHVSLQFRERKGDLINLENNRKNNQAIAKLVYIYEGIEKEAPAGKRHKLINPYYFCRVCNGKENRKLWDEVYEYIENHYEVNRIKKIYLNADGGAWIKSGKKSIAGITYVFDEFHLEKAVMKLTSHMKDRREDTRKELYEAIRKKKKSDFEEIVEKLEEGLKDQKEVKRIEDNKVYLLS